MRAVVNGVTDWKISTSNMKTLLPETCASNTAGNAIQPFEEIFLENKPDTAANTASSTTINGNLASAGMGLPKARVMRKLTIGEAIPTPSPHA